MRPDVWFVLLLVVGACVALPRPSDQDEPSVAALLTKCLKDSRLFLPCLQERAIKAWDQALRFVIFKKHCWGWL